MKQFLLTILMILSSALMSSQTYEITFTSESGTEVDEVNAKNLTTEETITFPGNETLILRSTATNINKIESISEVMLYSNLHEGYSEIRLNCESDQEVILEIIGLDGRILSSFKQDLSYGRHSFRLQSESKGLYLARLKTQAETTGLKFIQSRSSQNSISYLGSIGESVSLKSNKADYILNYSPNDIISYTLVSGANTTIVNEVPSQTKTISAPMVACTDYEGNNYKVVKIGYQIWMAENLNSTHYSDGTAIPHVTATSDWNALSDDYHDTDRAFCYYNNEEAQYGGLYTWAAAMDGANYSSTNPSGVQGACPTGWHLPSYYEWKELLDYLGGDVLAGPKLKATGMEYWNSPNDVATNESGFSALPAGYRDEYGDFNSLNASGAWWDTDRASTILGYSHWLHAGYDKVYQSNVRQSRGLSIRCVKD